MSKLKEIFFLPRYQRIIIILCWVASTLLYLKLFGIVTNHEAEKYINEAHYLLSHGSFSAPRYLFYSITVLLLALSFKMGLGVTGAFVMQAVINLGAFLFFHKALLTLYRSSITPLLIILYLLFFYPYQYWVVFLFTESVYFSFILMLFAAIVLYRPDNLKNILIAGGILILATLSRPLGILFWGSTIACIFYILPAKWKKIAAIAIVPLLIIGYYSINIIFTTIPDWRITQAFEQGSIICDLPGEKLTQPLDLAPPGNPVYELLYFLVHNPMQFLHFAGKKLVYFFFMSRPFYNAVHNYFLLANTIIVYLLAIIGFFAKKTSVKKHVIVFTCTAILLYAVTIMIQCDDYLNRFVLSIYPLFVILAARGAEQLSGFLFKNKQ